MWLRPRSLKHTPIKKGSNPKWEREEAHYAMPVHTRVHQVLTVALLDHDSTGDDEIGRYLSVNRWSCRCFVSVFPTPGLVALLGPEQEWLSC